MTGTLTIVRPLDNGYVAADACTGTSPTSSVNATYATVAANSLTTSVTTSGELCFTASTAGHTVFDTTGWWVD